MKTQNCGCNVRPSCPACLSSWLTASLLSVLCGKKKWNKIKGKTIFWLSLLTFWGSVPSYVSRGLFVFFSSQFGAPLQGVPRFFFLAPCPCGLQGRLGRGTGSGFHEKKAQGRKRAECASLRHKPSFCKSSESVCLSVCRSVCLSVWLVCSPSRLHASKGVLRHGKLDSLLRPQNSAENWRQDQSVFNPATACSGRHCRLLSGCNFTAN